MNNLEFDFLCDFKIFSIFTYHMYSMTHYKISMIKFVG